MPQVIVKVDKFGNTKVETEGFVGSACTEASAAIEQALVAGGGRKGPDVKKPEYYDAAAAGQSQTATSKW